MNERLNRLRAGVRPILLAGLAASLAWLVATEVIGHESPFFAPVAALVVVGLTVGQHVGRTLELVIGQAVGILIAELLVSAIGTGAAQIALVVVIAMGTAIAIGRGVLLTQQAAISAVLVATIQPPGSGLAGARFVDALVGGGVALVLNVLVFPSNPLRLVRRDASELLQELASTLEAIALALHASDEDQAETALERARELDSLAANLTEAIDASSDTLRYAPLRRSDRGQVSSHGVAAGRLDLAVRNVRVLARRSLRAIQRDEPVSERVVAAVRQLSEAARELDRQLEDMDGARPVKDLAIGAAELATEALEPSASLSVTVLVAQVRSVAVDLLQATGMETGEALGAIESLSDGRSSPS